MLSFTGNLDHIFQYFFSEPYFQQKRLQLLKNEQKISSGIYIFHADKNTLEANWISKMNQKTNQVFKVVFSVFFFHLKLFCYIFCLQKVLKYWKNFASYFKKLQNCLLKEECIKHELSHI